MWLSWLERTPDKGKVVGSTPTSPIRLCTQAATRADCKSAAIGFGGSSPSATIMKYYAIAIRGDDSHLLRDNFLDESGTLHSGILFFKKKPDAEAECTDINRVRKSMKLEECYSVVRVEEDCGIYGKIVDGKQA